jgi:hypothetical protein
VCGRVGDIPSCVKKFRRRAIVLTHENILKGLNRHLQISGDGYGGTPLPIDLKMRFYNIPTPVGIQRNRKKRTRLKCVGSGKRDGRGITASAEDPLPEGIPPITAISVTAATSAHVVVAKHDAVIATTPCIPILHPGLNIASVDYEFVLHPGNLIVVRRGHSV